jgi:predicted dehydrogenase
MQRWADAYANEVRDFVSCTLEDRAPSVTDEDARRATAIGMAATLSLEEARPVLVSEVG